MAACPVDAGVGVRDQGGASARGEMALRFGCMSDALDDSPNTGTYCLLH